MSRLSTVFSVAFVGAALLVTVGPAWAAAPSNDDWINAITISAGSVAGTVIDATNDGSASVGITGEPDVWYRFVAPADRSYTLTTCGTSDVSGLDTVLSIHSGPGTVANELEANDDWTTAAPFFDFCDDEDLVAPLVDSAVFFELTAGQIIWLRVARFSSSTNGTFELALRPFNDDRSHWLPLESGLTTGNLDGATIDGSSSAGSDQPDVWYLLYSEFPGFTVQVDTCGTHDRTGMDTILSAHVVVSNFPGFFEVAANDDWLDPGGDPTACIGLDGPPERDSVISFVTEQEQLVFIRVSRFGTGGGTEFDISLSVVPEPGTAIGLVSGVASLVALRGLRERRRRSLT